MTVQVLMSTMHRKKLTDLNLENRNIRDDILIINQTQDTDVYVDDERNIRMLNMRELGTSNSRNAAIKNASGDICIFADDDICYVKNYKEIILNEFVKDNRCDIITFQIMCPDGTPFKSNYMKKERYHNLRTVMKCASIEIAFKREAVINKSLYLDLEFGLGSRYRIHDDVIFLADAIRKGLKVKYVPIPIVIHPQESSGTQYNDFLIKSKGAAFARIFGLMGFIVSYAFAIKKRNDYKGKYSFFKFKKLISAGCAEYLKTH